MNDAHQLLINPADPRLGAFPGLSDWRQLSPAGRVAFALRLTHCSYKG